MTGNPRPVRVAIIGTGAIAHAHVDAVQKSDGKVELAAVMDVDRSRADAFCAKFGSYPIFTDLAEMLSVAKNIDLVHICTPPQTHVPLASMAMRAGVPVLIEKPPAMSLAEMDELASVQQETGVPALTVFQHRFGPAALRLKKLMTAGVLGRALYADCQTLWYRDDEYFDVPWRGRWEVEGGGPTMGHGIHQFDLMLSILGPWKQIGAMAGRLARPTETEDISIAVVQFENGALANVVNSVISPRETSRLRFDFEFATVELEHLYGYTEANWKFTPAPGHENLIDLWVEAPGTDRLSSHQLQLEAIVDALSKGTEPPVSLTDSRRTLEFAAAIYASSFRGTFVEAGSIGPADSFSQSMDGGLAPWAPLKEEVG